MPDRPLAPDLEQAVAAPPKLTVQQFPSAANPVDEIVLNLDEMRPIILDRPEPAALVEMLQTVEQRYIHSFWENVLCKPSPWCPRLPFGLSSWQKRTVTLIPPDTVTNALPSSNLGTLRTTQHVSSASFETLASAIRSLEPTNVNNALQLLSKAGIQRFNTSPLIEADHDYADFPELLSRLARHAAQPNGRIAAMALVTLRAAGFVALPAETVRRIRVFDSMRSADGWGPLIDFLTPDLKHLHDRLQPPSQGDDGPLYKNTLFRIYSAILSTSVTSIKDVSWPLLYALLKGTEFAPELRDHWRALCRQNPAPVASTSRGFEDEYDHRWSSSENSSVDAGTCERFSDPSGLSSGVLLNLDSSGPILLKDVTAPFEGEPPN